MQPALARGEIQPVQVPVVVGALQVLPHGGPRPAAGGVQVQVAIPRPGLPDAELHHQPIPADSFKPGVRQRGIWARCGARERMQGGAEERGAPGDAVRVCRDAGLADAVVERHVVVVVGEVQPAVAGGHAQ